MLAFRLAVVAACLSAVAVPAARADEFDTRAVRVDTRGLRLDTLAGQKTLQTRVRVAANAVCGTADSRDMAAMADLKACRKEAMFTAMSQVDIATASALSHQAGGAVVSSNTR